MDAAIRNQGASIKALEIQIRQMSKDVLKELEKLQVNLTKSGTSLGRLLEEKWRIKKEIKGKMNKHCLTIVRDALSP
nr:hypothetical protein [Tanacetum cinerariifolium]